MTETEAVATYEAHVRRSGYKGWLFVTSGLANDGSTVLVAAYDRDYRPRPSLRTHWAGYKVQVEAVQAPRPLRRGGIFADYFPEDRP